MSAAEDDWPRHDLPTTPDDVTVEIGGASDVSVNAADVHATGAWTVTTPAEP